MDRDTFAILLEKYLEGTCTEEEQKLVEYWLALSEPEGDALENAQAAETELDEAGDRMWQMIHEQTSPEFDTDTKPFFFKNSFLTWAGIAASLVLVAWLWTKQSRNEAVASHNWIEQRNENAGHLLVKLEDGSTVDLAPYSSVRYPSHFEDKIRVVTLHGKAFFSVARDTTRPFLVQSGETVTRVLGTSFDVETSTGGRSTKVEVATGLVSVSGKKPGSANAGVLLKPNHKVTFDAETGKFSKGLTGHPRLQNASISFRFRNAPLARVTRDLQMAWGIRIEAANPAVLHCPLTADLTGQSLYTQLDIICAAVGARYAIHGTTIFIYGQGCKLSAYQSAATPKLFSISMKT